MNKYRNYFGCMLASLVLAMNVPAQAAEEAAGADEPAFVTGVLSEREIRFYDAEYGDAGKMSVRDFEKLFVDIPQDTGETAKGLPIKALNKAYGLLQISITDGTGTRDVWVTRNSVEMWPKPEICQDSVRGRVATPQTSLTVGAGGCTK